VDNAHRRNSERLANYLGREECDRRLAVIDRALDAAQFMVLPLEVLSPEPVEIASCDFDGSRLGTVTLTDGREVDVLVEIDESGRGARFASFTALSQRDESWVRAHEAELLVAWDAREVG